MERRLTAILAADVVGYSRLMGLDEAGTLSALKAHRRELSDGKIAEHQGRIFKLTGDGMLVEFPSVVNAVACAADIQRRMRERNADVPQNRRIEFRIGIHLGDIIVDENDIYGDGVNVAARIESVAPAGGVSVSGSVRDNVGNRLDLQFEDRGEQTLKNIELPVRIYDVAIGPSRLLYTNVKAPPLKKNRPSIAVLPFANMSGDPEQEYFSDGMTEDLITDLSKISALFVVGRNTVFTFKGKAVKSQQVAAELGVKFLLEGSVRKAGQRVRITSQLIDGASGGHLWADRYDRDLTDIFAVQDEITRTIVDQLKIKLLPEEKKAIEAAPTGNVEAYTYYLRGRQFLHMKTRAFLQLARRMFAKAVELDPLYARAYAGMADCDSMLKGWHGVEISLDGLLATAARALELDPGLAEAHAARGHALATTGRREEAIAEFERALELDPDLYEANYFYGRFCMLQGDYERAVEVYTRAAEILPDDYRSPIHLMNIFRTLGRHDEEVKFGRIGIERAEQVLRLHPEGSDPAQLGACALAGLGDHERAREWTARALAIDPDDYQARYNAACVYALVGEADRAIDILETYLKEVGLDMKLWFRRDSDFDSIRGHPRYPSLLALIEETETGRR